MTEAKPTICVKPIAWDSPEGEAARRIRLEVFVDEQLVPREIEIDTLDPIAYHVVAYKDGREPMATGRAFDEPRVAGSWRIGRMAALAAARGQGYGGAVLRALIEEGLRRGCENIRLDSQLSAIDFYAHFGFVVCGPEHEDAGIVHRMMELPATQAALLFRTVKAP